MSPAPDHTPLGEIFAERYSPLQPPDVDAQHDYAYGHLAEAMMRPFEQLAELIDPPDPYEPWTPLFFVDITPDWALPWLGQVVGVQIPATATPEQAREIIKSLSFEEVGKPAAIKAALALTLDYPEGEEPYIYFREREPNAYCLEIVTLVEQTPDPAQSLRAIQSQLPAAIKLSFRQIAGWDYQALTDEAWLYSVLPTTFDTYREMSDNDRNV